MTMTNPNDDMLDNLFAQARAVTAVPSDDLVARVLADAGSVQPPVTPVSARRLGLWFRMSEAIGGWPAVSGLAAATIAGVWVGVAPPASIEDLTATFIGDEVSISLFSTDLAFDAGELIDG